MYVCRTYIQIDTAGVYGLKCCSLCSLFHQFSIYRIADYFAPHIYSPTQLGVSTWCWQHGMNPDQMMHNDRRKKTCTPPIELVKLHNRLSSRKSRQHVFCPTRTGGGMVNEFTPHGTTAKESEGNRNQYDRIMVALTVIDTPICFLSKASKRYLL